MEIQITDPTYDSQLIPSYFNRIAVSRIVDPRDLPFVRLILSVALTVIPFAVYLFCSPHFSFWVGGLYLLLVMGHFFAPVILMLHNTSHRVLFRTEVTRLNSIIPWVISPFFGQTPGTYFSHHIGMHHIEGNLPEDLSSTMEFQRDSFLGFLHYLGDFYVFGFARLVVYFRDKKRFKLLRKILIGELSFYLMVSTLAMMNTRATVFVFVVPFCVGRFGMMAGNWAQHAFVDSSDPANPYRNSITCINTSYNRRCFNDGYHIGHHLKSSRHWTLMPQDFLQNRDLYAREQAIVFNGIDYFGVWCCLMLKRYDWLARRFVQFGQQSMSQDEVICLLRNRTRKISRETYGIILMN